MHDVEPPGMFAARARPAALVATRFPYSHPIPPFLALAGPHPRSLSLGGAASPRFPPAPRSGRRRSPPAPPAPTDYGRSAGAGRRRPTVALDTLPSHAFALSPTIACSNASNLT